MADEDDINEEFEGLHRLLDDAREELDPILAGLFDSLAGRDFEDPDLFEVLVRSGLLDDLARCGQREAAGGDLGHFPAAFHIGGDRLALAQFRAHGTYDRPSDRTA